MAKKRILMLGITSAIVEHMARSLVAASSEHELYVVGRNAAKVAEIAQDLAVRAGGASLRRVHCAVFDLDQVGGMAHLLAQVKSVMGGIDILVLGYGVNGVQAELESSQQLTQQLFHTNLISPLAILELIASEFTQQQHGTIAVVTSVAGERGRKANYIYGASKAALITVLSGMRQRLATKGIKVVDLRPGFVDTPMTKDYKKGPLWASAEKAGKICATGLLAGRDVVYVPGFWRLIMLIIRYIPESVFKKLNF